MIPSVNTRFPGAAPLSNDVLVAADVHVNAVAFTNILLPVSVVAAKAPAAKLVAIVGDTAA